MWPGPDEVPDWRALVEAIENEPPWGPLHRAREPRDWKWYVPGYDELVTLMELTRMGNVQRGGGKKQDLPKRIPRPWDKTEKQLTATVVAPEVIDKRLAEILPAFGEI